MVPAAAATTLGVGDYFRYVGPTGRWTPASRRGWQPRAWTSHPADPASRRIPREELFLDFSIAFRIEDLVEETVQGHRFVTARVTVRGAGHDVWLNISRDGWPWAVAVDAPETAPGGGGQ